MNALQTEKLAILFADISGSTALYEKLGDEKARRLITDCLTLLTTEAIRHQGALNKIIGDEILCTFPSSASALEAACAMQSAIESNQPDAENPMYIRIGFHYGEVTCAGGEVSGEVANIAARITSVTRAHQVLTTSSSVEALPADLRNRTRQIMRKGILGSQDTSDIFLVIWGQADTQPTRIGQARFRKPNQARHELILRHAHSIITINEQHHCILIGRSEACEIAVDHHLVSRQHARIEFIFNKFTIADLSSNGTFVRFSNGQEIQLERKQIVLHGSGTISPGVPYSDYPTELIEFILQ